MTQYYPNSLFSGGVLAWSLSLTLITAQLVPEQTHEPASVNLSVGSLPNGTVSPYLSTMSIVYAWAPDSAGYSNGTIARWAQANHVNTVRFPAGMASYWNWENPSGCVGKIGANICCIKYVYLKFCFFFVDTWAGPLWTRNGPRRI